MESREVINIGKEGAAASIDYRVDEERWWPHYQEMMTLFLRQGGIVQSVTIQVISDDLHLTLKGTEGNLLYFKINKFFEERREGRLPIQGDFVLHATKANTQEGNVVEDMQAYRQRAPENRRNSVVGKVLLSQWERSSYTRDICLSTTTTDERYLSLGLASLAIPIATVRQANSAVVMKALASDPQNVSQPEINRHIIEEIEENGLPLVLHVSSTSTNRYSPSNNVSLLCTHSSGIVFNTEDDPLDLSGIGILCELEEGGLKRSISKISKKRPFGLLELHCDVRNAGEEICRLKVVNLVDDNGAEERETQNIRTKDAPIRYVNGALSSACASTNYGRIFDIFLSNRRPNPSMARILSSIKSEPETESSIKELIGISERGRMVVGFESLGMTAICTVSPVERNTPVDTEYLSPGTGGKKVRKSGPAVETQPKEEPKQETPTELLANVWYRKWKEYSDGWHTARRLPSPIEITPVFMAYMNSGEMNQEDIDEYNRLLEQ